MVLAKYDIRGIQSFIFHTDKLREIRAVQDLPERIVFEALKVSAGVDENSSIAELEKNGIKILDKAGGNAFVLFEAEEKYKKISKAMAVYILKKTYSLKLVYACVECTDNFYDDYEKLNQKLGRLKSSMPEPVHMGAFPICSQDLQTGLPIADVKFINGVVTYLTQESVLKEKYHIRANGSQGKIDSYIKGKNEDSHIAVIHIDGNNMGNRINEILKTATYDTAKDVFGSIKVRDSFKEVCSEMSEYIKNYESKKTLQNGKHLIYSIIQAGDDITYITRADIALSFTKLFLQKVSEKFMYKDSDMKYSISACAGIAFCHSHFPFADAYELAERCCSSAKKRAKETQYLGVDGFIGNWVDFEFCEHIRNIDIESSRIKYGKTANTNLLLRPYCVAHPNCNQNLNDKIAPFDFEVFENKLLKLTNKNKVMINRSRAKSLREAYSRGENAVKIMYNGAVSRGYDAGELYIDVNGSKTAVMYDVIDVMDYYLSLEE